MAAQLQFSKSTLERDQALFEAEELRGKASRAEEAMRQARARAESETASRAALEQQLAGVVEEKEQQHKQLEAR